MRSEVLKSASSHCGCPRHHTLFLLRYGKRSVLRVCVEVKQPSTLPANALCSTEWLVSAASRHTERHIWPDQHMNQNHKYSRYKWQQFFKDIETTKRFVHGSGESNSCTSRKGNVTRCCGL